MKRSQKQSRRRRDRDDRPLSPYAKKHKTPHRYEEDHGSYTTTPDEGEVRRRPRHTKRSSFRPFTRPGSS